MPDKLATALARNDEADFGIQAIKTCGFFGKSLAIPHEAAIIAVLISCTIPSSTDDIRPTQL
jgi:hypothetical protein